MNDKLHEIERRFERLTTELSNPEVLGSTEKFQKVARERASLEPVVNAFREWTRVGKEIDENEELLEEKDEEIRALAKEELPALRERLDTLNQELKLLLLPKDPADEKNVILEIRQGVGGGGGGRVAAARLRM